jgi:hypothetical protein
VRTLGLSWPLLVLVIAVLGVLAHPRPDALLSDPDTLWHIAAGRWIYDHGVVPSSDPFSHSMPGAAWTAHEWLSELVLAGVHRLAGWAGLVVLAALAFAATLAYLTRFLLARLQPVHALLFVALAAGMLMGHLYARPHVLAWPLLALWAGSLVDAGEQGRGPPWWLLALMVLWANLHGSFTLGLALGAALALDAVLRLAPANRPAAVWCWAGFVALSVAAAMITPSGWQGIWYTFEVMRQTEALKAINEWRSPDFQQLQILELWLMLMLAIGCGGGGMRLPWLRLLLVLGLTHLALKHGRNISILGLLSPILIAAPLARQWKGIPGAGHDAKALDRVFLALAVPARKGAVVAAALALVLTVAVALHSGRYAPLAARWPESAVQAAERAGALGPVLNAYGFGGYLIYSGIPVFIDGRSDVYGDALLKRMANGLGLNQPAELQRLIDDYRIGWTLLEPGMPALALLDTLPGWKRVYADSVAVVHMRETGVAQ